MSLEDKVKVLWRICFDDTPDFVNLYFQLRYKDDRNMGIMKDGQLLSALQIIPYEMNSWGTFFHAAYLSGVCTNPFVRKQGLMRQLLGDTHRRLYAEDCSVSTLIPAEPWLFDCYAKSGYAPLFYYDWTTVTPKADDEDDASIYVSSYKDNAVGVYQYFYWSMRERPCCIQHTTDDFTVIMSDLYLSKGELWVARLTKTDEVCGVAFCIPQADNCRINELMADNDSISRALVCHACRQCHVESAEVIHPSDNNAHRLGMLRIVRLDDILARYAEAHPTEERCWLITDPEIPENNGCFQIQKGEYRLLDKPVPDAPTLTIGQLASLLWRDDHPYMSLMLN